MNPIVIFAKNIAAHFIGAVIIAPMSFTTLVPSEVYENYESFELRCLPGGDVVVRPTDAALINDVSPLLAAASARVQPELGPDENQRAILAVRDAEKFIGSLSVTSLPIVNVTEDGIATMQWRTSTAGIMLFFGGDGIVTISNRDNTTGYSESLRDYEISSNISIYVSDMILKLNS